MTEGFDPSRYLTKVGSADYLEVKWRIVWLRELHPDALIETELIAHGEQAAIFKARVVIPGGGSATGFGSEGYDDFRDYIEKAETKAIGRALGALGFGTQFCPDFDFGASAGKVVDSPIDRGRRMATGNATPSGNGEKPMIQNPAAPASDNQLNYIRGLAKQMGMVMQGPAGDDHVDETALKAAIGIDYDADWPAINKGKASEIIEGFKGELKRRATA